MNNSFYYLSLQYNNETVVDNTFRMEYKTRKHNTLISTLIKQYLDKEGGKVTVSRREIEWRFNALDWRFQKQILFAFLASGMSDRTWACRKLFVFWDKCFIPEITDLWEMYPSEEMLTWLIIRYFPINFLQENFMRLDTRRNYFYLCVRLSDVKGFVIDRSRLNERDLLRIKLVLGEPFTLNYVKDLFYLLIYKYCKGAYNIRTYSTCGWDSQNHPILSILDRPLIRKMLDEIKDLGVRGFDLFFQLQDWMRTVTTEFLSLHEGTVDKSWDKEEEPKMRKMQMEFCYEQIDPEYRNIWDTFDCHNQQQFIDYLDNKYEQKEKKEVGKAIKATTDDLDRIIKNPILSKLLGQLDIEMIDDHPS